jgi:hypothetical protein
MESVHLQTEGKKYVIIGLSMLFVLMIFIITFIIFVVWFYATPGTDIDISIVNRNRIKCSSERFGNRCQYIGPYEDWYYLHVSGIPSNYEKLYAPTNEDKLLLFRKTSNDPEYKSLFIRDQYFYRSKHAFQFNQFIGLHDNPLMVHKRYIREFLPTGMISNSWTGNLHKKNSQLLKQGEVNDVHILLPKEFLVPSHQNEYRMILSTSRFHKTNFDKIYSQGNTKFTRVYNESNNNLENIPFSWHQSNMYIMYM